MQIPRVKLSRALEKKKKARERDIFVSETGARLVRNRLVEEKAISIHMVTPQPFNYFN